jgi:hypothetical protein
MNQQERIRRAVSVDEAGCWNWQLGRDRVGYGRVKVQMGARESFRTTSAHRYAYELWVGPIPDGMNVLHRCDNPPCCNPGHLFLGTQRDNMADMHNKGRGPRGYTRDSETCRANALRRAAIAAASQEAKG